MRVVYFGSGSFGIPTIDALRSAHEVVLVVSQPARPAGRRRNLTPTPIAAYAADHRLELTTPADPNAAADIQRVRAAGADAFVVIAYGHKLSPALLGETFAINLHASLLPKYRGAAPINRAMMAGEVHTGVSVIMLSQAMDAGAVLATRSVAIDPHETAGELHDRLAALGPGAVLDVLDAFGRDDITPVAQDEASATRAPKLTKAEGTVRFDQPAARVRAIVHGLTPWPGCTVQVAGERIKLLRVQDDGDDAPDRTPGTVDETGRVRCARGALRLLSVQPAGGRAMTFDAYRRGRRLADDVVVEPLK